MLSLLEQLDIDLLIWIHTAWRAAETDAFFLWITQLRHFMWPLACAWVLLFLFGGREGRWLAVGLVLCVVATDQVSSQLIKPWVARVRPCFALDVVTPLLPQAQSPSFPSSHAANTFGVAGMLIYTRGRRWAWLVLVAGLIALSRVYVGVHYPSDILAGAALGLILAWIVWRAVLLLRVVTEASHGRADRRQRRDVGSQG